MVSLGTWRRHRNGPQPATVLVVGTFRSGTNLMKHCLEAHFEAAPVYNTWFWKHGVPPTGIQVPVPPDVPIVVMSRDPVATNASLYRFWQARRPDLDLGATISDFVRRRLVVYDNTEGDRLPRYSYPNPTEYWNQFYYSWLHWKAVEPQRVFIRCDDLVADPERIVAGIADRFALRRRGTDAVTLPGGRVGPPADYAPGTSGGLTEEDIRWIRAAADPEVAAGLGYAP